MRGHLTTTLLYAPKLATCKRCGSTNVIWHQDAVTKKWRLVEWCGLGTAADGHAYNPAQFHKCPAPKGNAHED